MSTVRTTIAFVVACAATTVRADLYRIDWSSERAVWSGTIDTATDTLTIDAWNNLTENDLYVDWAPEVGAVWPALDGDGRHDIPDEWNGYIDHWGFIAPKAPDFHNWRPGIGCSAPGDFQECVVHYRESLAEWAQWYRGGRLDAYFFATRIDIQPIRGVRIFGDVNLDQRFDSGDIVAIFAAGRYETGEAASWADGDWTGDGLFDSGDIVAAFAGGGYDRGTTAAVAVPEPSAILLALALFGLVFARCCYR